MPKLVMTSSGVDTFKLPVSGVTVVMRRKATGGDISDVIQAVRGDQGFNSRHSYALFLRYMSATLIESWDAVDDEGNPIPVSPQTLVAIQDQHDYEKITTEAGARTELRDEKDEAPLEEPSSTSSQEKKSSPETSPDFSSN